MWTPRPRSCSASGLSTYSRTGPTQRGHLCWWVWLPTRGRGYCNDVYVFYRLSRTRISLWNPIRPSGSAHWWISLWTHSYSSAPLPKQRQRMLLIDALLSLQTCPAPLRTCGTQHSQGYVCMYVCVNDLGSFLLSLLHVAMHTKLLFVFLASSLAVYDSLYNFHLIQSQSSHHCVIFS